MSYIFRFSLVIIFFLKFSHGFCQEINSLSLEKCYELAFQNHPISKQKSILKSTNELTLKNIETNYLPVFDFNAQGTYQSDVVSFPSRSPLVSVPELYKDQYKISVDFRQVLYDGGSISNQKKVKESELIVEEQKIEVELLKLKERINQMYFNIILANENILLTDLLKNDITNKLDKINAGIKAGAMLETSADVMRAELIKINQRKIEILSGKKAALEMLSEIIGQHITGNTLLQIPAAGISITDSIGNRPEILLFKYQLSNIDDISKSLSSKRLPRLNAFGQAGYGRPAFNFFEPDFETFYIVGLKLNWNIFDWRLNYREKQILSFKKELILNQKDLFVNNTNIMIRQQFAEIEKLQSLIETDKELIELRTKIKNTSSVQLDNGIITATDYLTDANTELQAKLNLKARELQLILAKINYLTTLGKN